MSPDPNTPDPLPALPPRPPDAHKGTFGTVVVIGGCPTMIGAPALAATAAFRSGAGLVKVLAAPGLIPHILTIQPSATAISMPDPGDVDSLRRILGAFGSNTALAVGPGMGRDPARRALVQSALSQTHPVVLDADGLNNLADAGGFTPVASGGPLVLTPHPGEFTRLAEAAGLAGLDPIGPDRRPASALALARHYQAIVVLKGRHTVIADPELRRTAINTTGNPALATAGSGDILTGVIASLIAQGMNAYDAARAGVHLHGLAADLWVAAHGGRPVGLTASDLADTLPAAISAYNPDASRSA